MILNELLIQNVGPFRGLCRFDLAPESPDRPIVVIGGKNGAGKTTVFESIPLALYGQQWRTGVSRKEYEQHLLEILHSNQDLPVQPDVAMVEIEFSHTQLDRSTTYRVRRAWKKTGKGVKEDLEIRKDGQVLDDLDQDQWHDFLKELIPRGVSDLFFFDGEKVKELAADDESHREAFQESFEALMGFDVIRQLSSDLSFVISREVKKKNIGDVGPEFEKIEQEESDLKEERDSITYKKARYQRDLDRVIVYHEKLQSRFAKEGGGFAEKRGKLMEKKAGIEAKIESLEDRMRALVQDSLPLSLSAYYVKRLVERLEKSEKNSQWQAAGAVFEEVKADLEKHLVRYLRKNGDSDQQVKREVRKALKAYNLSVPSGDEDQVHSMSGSEQIRILALCRRALTEVPKEARSVQKELEKAHRELSRVQAQLQKAPDDDQLAPIVEELGVLNRDIGELRGRIQRAEEDLAKCNRKAEELVRAKEKLADRLKESHKDSQVLRFAAQSQKALDDYCERLKEEKRIILSDHLTECMNFLSNKGDYYRDVSIDESLQLKIITKDGSARPHKRLSAGERQILATALIWALAKTSGRPLPFMIDTPLGRLDSDHRTHLIDRFFPNASHQVLILSTDTEIDQNYFDQLEPWTSRSYLLAHDRQEHQTQAKEGYFWRKNVEVAQ